MALYRKYRPASFAEMVGQEQVTVPLSRALDSGKINHAYLFSGPRGCGKTSSARILARSLNCVEGPTSKPCGVCDSCVSLAPNGPGNFDVTELDAASHNGVEDMRELRDRAHYAPSDSRYRIFIIDEAHMISSSGANALLKIVEEPPAHLIFIFATTEPEKVIGTIRSRTHNYPFRLLTPGDMHALLARTCAAEGVAVEESVYPLVIRAGGGSPRDSLSILDQLIAGSGDGPVSYELARNLLGLTDSSLIDASVAALASRDAAGLFRAVDAVIQAGLDPRRYASDLLDRLRDLMILQSVDDAFSTGLIDAPADYQPLLREQAAAFSQELILAQAGVLNDHLQDLKGATSPRLLLEIICARMLNPGAGAPAAPVAAAPAAAPAAPVVPPSAPIPPNPAKAPAAAVPPRQEHRPEPRPEPTPAPTPAPQQPAKQPAQQSAQQPAVKSPIQPIPQPPKHLPPMQMPTVNPAAQQPAQQPKPEPVPAPEPEPQQPEPQQPAVDEDAHLAEIRKNSLLALLDEQWQQIKDAVYAADVTAGVLFAPAKVVDIQDNVVIVNHTTVALANRLAAPEVHERIRATMNEILGLDLDFRCEVHANPKAPSLPSEPEPEPEPEPQPEPKPEPKPEPVIPTPATDSVWGAPAPIGTEGPLESLQKQAESAQVQRPEIPRFEPPAEPKPQVEAPKVAPARPAAPQVPPQAVAPAQAAPVYFDEMAPPPDDAPPPPDDDWGPPPVTAPPVTAAPEPVPVPVPEPMSEEDEEAELIREARESRGDSDHRSGLDVAREMVEEFFNARPL
ncbi:MAG: DNA polymerase III subunit gamma and tau [Corynebacterium sp.]|nr:DNA polymerase III subunit gamma and tau [Corynebacterium sp.]